MSFTSCSNSASTQQLLSRAKNPNYSFPKTLQCVPTTRTQPGSSFCTPKIPKTGCMTTNHGINGPSNTTPPLATAREAPKPVVGSKRQLNEVHEVGTEVKLEIPTSEDQDLESTSNRIHSSKGEASSAQKQLSLPKGPSSGSSELDPRQILGGVVDELARTVVEKFNSIHGSDSIRGVISPSPDKCRKRSRLGPCPDSASARLNCDVEETDHVLDKQTPEASLRIWPCPFFTKDKKKYHSCWTRHCLLSLDDVREHLCTIHLEPIHCPVCYGTFQTVRLRDEHMRSQECHFELPPGFDGLRHSQVQDLQRQEIAEDKAPRLQEMQWVKMWCIVFSSTRRPRSPFSFSQPELAVYEFRCFWERHGQLIVANVLKNHVLQRSEIEIDEASLQALFSRVADHAVDLLLPIENN